MTELQFCYEVSLDFSSPVHDHAFVLRCLPHDMPEQILLWSELIIQPEPHRISFGGDAFGNRLITGFLPEQHDSFRYSVEGRARRDDSERLHFQTPLTCYRYPSGMTQPSPEMARFLADCNIDFHGCTLEAAEELSEAVHEYFEYVPGVTGTATTAAESFAMRQGVCQDYAQCYIVWPAILPATSAVSRRGRARATPGRRSALTVSGRAWTPPGTAGPERPI